MEALVSAIYDADPAQVRAAPHLITSSCRELKELALSRSAPASSVLPALLHAITVQQPRPGLLTPVHADLLQMCLLARHYRLGYRTVEQVKLVDTRTTGVTNRDLLLFLYYSGMVCIGLKKYAQAVKYLSQTIQCTSTNPNAIVIASYKKLVLCSLIAHGQVVPLPKSNSLPLRSLKSSCQMYVDLANSFATSLVQNMQHLISTHQDNLERDSNLGLAKQTLHSLQTGLIQRLTKTYLTLPLNQIAASASLSSTEEAKQRILYMMDCGDINAKIDEENSMVSFKEDEEQFNNEKALERLRKHMERTNSLCAQVTSLDDEISVDKFYVNKLLSSERHGRFGDHGGSLESSSFRSEVGLDTV